MAWSIVGVGAVAETLTTTLTLTEPAGVANGDLLVACIASRSTATTAITSPNWALAGQRNTNNVLTTTSAAASACILHRVRSGAPSLSFTLPAGNSVTIGRIIAYRTDTGTPALDLSANAATAINITAVSLLGITTAVANDLVVSLMAGGQEATWSNFRATTPATGSGATDTTTAPSTTAWAERADSVTLNGAQTSLGVFDAVKSTAGGTGNVLVTASLAAVHTVVISAFKAVVAGTADAWNLNDKSSTVTLSVVDKKGTTTSASASGARSSTVYMNGNAGAFYAELVIDNTIGGSAPLAGIRSTGGLASTSSTPYSSVAVAGNNGNILLNGGTVLGSLGSAFANGDVLCIAWNSGTERIWFRLNGGNWNNDASADPATGTNGLDVSALEGLHFGLWFTATASATALTIRTELAEYTQTVPSGFTSWMGETPSSGTNVTVAATGVAAGTALGTATASTVWNAAATPVGVAAGTALGTVVVDAVAPVSFEAVGVAAGTALGTATATGKTNISTAATGVTATALLGAATVNTVWNVSATSAGVAAGTALGTATAAGVANVSTTPIGQVAATALGNVAVAAGGAVSVIPGGVTATALTGTATVTAKISVNVTPTGVSAAAVTASGATAPSSSLLTSFTPGANRNDFTGEVGVRYGIAGANITVTWLGVFCSTGSGTRTVKINEWFADANLRTVTVDMAGKTPGTWVWTAITPLTLLASGYYAVLQEVTASDGLQWTNADVNAIATAGSEISDLYSTYRVPGGGLNANTLNAMYVGLDLGSGASGAGGVVVTIASTAQATGAAAATALGTATVTANRSAAVTPTGVAATTALGGVSIAVGGGISITPSSLAVTALSGTATVAAQQQVSTLAAGASATALSGTAGVSVRSSVAASGVSATALTGTATVTANQSVTTTAAGVTANALLGGVSVTAGGSVSVAAAGQSATALTGTATVTAKRFVSTAATGVTAASALGIATATGTIVVAANTVGVWTGTAWVQKPAKVWSGSVWMTKPVKTWNGGAWV